MRLHEPAILSARGHGCAHERFPIFVRCALVPGVCSRLLGHDRVCGPFLASPEAQAERTSAPGAFAELW